MATCPGCFGYLHHGHQCRGRFFQTWKRWAIVAAVAIVGGYAINVAFLGDPSVMVLPVTTALAGGLVDAFAREAFSV